jgi:hypothetical protein
LPLDEAGDECLSFPRNIYPANKCFFFLIRFYLLFSGVVLVRRILPRTVDVTRLRTIPVIIPEAPACGTGTGKE